MDAKQAKKTIEQAKNLQKLIENLKKEWDRLKVPDQHK